MSEQAKRQLKLGVFLQGGGGHWREPDVKSNGAVSIDTYQKFAQIAERGKFDFGFIADSAYISKDSTEPFLSRLEPLSALSAVSAVTKNIGLVGTFTTSYSEPFTTARQLASLDIISDGRAGWNAVTSALEGVAKNHGYDKIHDHATRYEIADEYIEVVTGLWDSWEDDAFVRNKETGEYADLNKMHTLNHVGKHFKVQGPLNLEPSKQGRPVLFQAGASEPGLELAAKYADAVFTNMEDSGNLEHAQQRYSDLKARVAKHGRNPDELFIFPSISPFIGDTEEEAKQAYEDSVRFIDPHYAVKYLSRYFSFFDFSQFPLDEPLPELGDIGKDSFRSTAEFYLNLAKKENLTLRQLALRATNPKGDFVGTPQQVADKIEKYFHARAFDGVILANSHKQIQLFVDKVVPLLQEKGIFRTEYESDTLRGNLGISYPENRYTVAKRKQLV